MEIRKLQADALPVSQILSLLERYAQEPCIRPVLADAQEVERLLELYSFRTPQLAERFCDQLHNRYRFEGHPAAPLPVGLFRRGEAHRLRPCK